MTSPLAQSARIVAELRDRLKAEYVGLEDGDEALETSLEGATNLPELLATLARRVRENEAFSETVGRMQKEMAARAARYETTAQNLRVQIAWALCEAGMKRIPADALPEMTVTLREGKAPLVIQDHIPLPDELCRLRREPIKSLIREALEAGNEVPGAYLGNPMPSLSIRTK